MPKSIVELKDRQRSAPDWIVPGLLKRGNTAIMIGQPKKACKSWLVLALCWDLAEGKPVWAVKKADGTPVFQPERPMRSVYFTQEDTEDDIHDRVLNHLERGGRSVNDRLWIEPKNLQIAFDSLEGRRLIQEKLDKVRETGPIDLVAFDPMRRMHHGDENDSKTIVQIWQVLDRIHQRYGCATLLTHHIAKPPMDRSNWDPTDPFVGRGSGDIYGGGDAFIMVVPSRGDETHRILGVHYESKRGAPLPPSQLKVTYGSGGVEYLGAGWERKREESAVNL